eukprot:m.2515 g.2515  ORF g.2515 m.2515 type:complete len:90 (+) comp1815_c0_seq1:335-604(+)
MTVSQIVKAKHPFHFMLISYECEDMELTPETMRVCVKEALQQLHGKVGATTQVDVLRVDGSLVYLRMPSKYLLKVSHSLASLAYVSSSP